MGSRRRVLQASSTLGGLPAPQRPTYGASTLQQAATTVTLAQMLDVMATLTPAVHVTRVELGHQGYERFVGALRAMADDASNYVVADPLATETTWAGIRIVERPDFHPEQAELVFSDGRRQPLDVRQTRDA